MRNLRASFESFLGRTRVHLALLSGVALMTLCAAQPAQALTIVPSFDASWAAAPAGATTDVTNVIAEFQGLFSNAVTVEVAFGWNEVAGHSLAAGGAATSFPQIEAGFPNPADQYSLAATKTLLTNASAAQPTNGALATAVANLPATYPNPGGTGMFFISDPEYLALTGAAQNADVIMAYTGYAANFCGGGSCPYDFTGGVPPAGAFDFTAIVEHELSHALGRVDWGFSGGAGNQPPFLTPQDFYKYDCGTSNLDPKFQVTCFSIDGGATNPGGRTFSGQSDSGDWINSNTDSFNAFAFSGTQGTVSPADITLMCALGWNGGTACGGAGPAVPEPGTLSLLGISLLAVARRRKRT